MFTRPHRHNLLLNILYLLIFIDAINTIMYYLRTDNRNTFPPIPGFTGIFVSVNYVIVMLGMFIQTLHNCHTNTGPLSRGICQKVLDTHRRQFLIALENLPLACIWHIEGRQISKIVGLLKEQAGFVCPLTNKTFEYPMISFATGLSYEKLALEEHIERNGDICPVTGQKLLPIVENHTLKKLIAEIPDHLKRQNIMMGHYRVICHLLIKLLKAFGININEDYFLPNYVENIYEMHDAISREKFNNPVVTADGHSYEEKFINDWLEHSNISLVTQRMLPHKNYCQNIDLKRAVETIEAILKAEETMENILTKTKEQVDVHLEVMRPD
jgi:hypothetical protein